MWLAEPKHFCRETRKSVVIKESIVRKLHDFNRHLHERTERKFHVCRNTIVREAGGCSYIELTLYFLVIATKL